jgi:proteic killer suppression protein
MTVKQWLTFVSCQLTFDHMVRSFRSKGLKRFAETGNASKLSVQKPDRLRRILLRLDASVTPQEMNAPGYRFHALKGGDKGRFAVWASENYRVTFGWDGEDAIDVDLEDYH